jgi:ACS family hexuronate transporter-like MFS transporter
MKEPSGNYRWTICALVFFATTINYLDRAVISLLKPTLEKQFNWSESDYSNIVIAFQISYAIGMIGAGWLIDRLGTKIGYALSLALWSVAAICHGFVRSTFGFIVARAALGVTESGNFPAAIKTVAEWFPKKERALATGIFNSGTNVGAILAPFTVPYIAVSLGWQWAFILTGAIGLIWLIFWFALYETPSRHKRISKSEYDFIHAGDKEQDGKDITVSDKRGSWVSFLGVRQTWALILGKFLTDPVWWFYLFWLPAFLKAQYGLENTEIVLPVGLVYVMAAVGSIAGGWLPLRLISRNWPVAKARRISMLVYALAVLPVVFAQYAGSANMWYAVLLIGLAASAHQAWSANMYTTASDVFPKQDVGSVTGLGGMGGAVGGILIAKLAGVVFDHYKAQGNLEYGYTIMFIVCGLAYIVAWGLMQILLFRRPSARA